MGRPLISGTIPLIGLHGNHGAPRGGECTPLFQPPHLHSTLISCAHSAWFCPRRLLALMSQEDMLLASVSLSTCPLWLQGASIAPMGLGSCLGYLRDWVLWTVCGGVTLHLKALRFLSVRWR